MGASCTFWIAAFPSGPPSNKINDWIIGGSGDNHGDSQKLRFTTYCAAPLLKAERDGSPRVRRSHQMGVSNPSLSATLIKSAT
jgi:hypothetical protein